MLWYRYLDNDNCNVNLKKVYTRIVCASFALNPELDIELLSPRIGTITIYT